MDPGEQVPRGGQEDPRLAEGGQHLADVAEEGGARPDDQYAAPGEELAVGVEEVGGAVQGDGRLAGAGAALYDKDAAVRGSDDAVLLGLDGPHDVVHAAGPCGVEGGEQYGVRVSALVPGAFGVGEVEDLVVQGGDLRPRVVMCRRRRSPIGTCPVAR